MNYDVLLDHTPKRKKVGRTGKVILLKFESPTPINKGDTLLISDEKLLYGTYYVVTRNPVHIITNGKFFVTNLFVEKC